MRLLEEEDYLGKDDGPPSIQRSGSYVCISPSLLINSFSRKSLSYNKLPQEPLRLTVLKLDGSSFEIEVAKDGTVAELKRAVEVAFRHLSKRVSWSHVWGHFCLFYDGQKLLSDNDDIGCYGIKDGDQLQFIRHVSVNYDMRRALSESDIPNFDEPSISNEYEGGQQLGVENHFQEDIENRKGSNEYHEENIENRKGSDDDFDYATDEEEVEDNGVTMTCQYKLANLFRRWFSYRKLSSSDLRIEQRSKLSNGMVGSFKNFVRLSSQRQSWKAE